MSPEQPAWQKFHSFAEAKEMEDAYYRNMTPQQRMEVLFELVSLMRPGGSDWDGITAAIYDVRTGEIRRVLATATLPP